MLAFVDESGFPHPNDETLHPVLAAVCIPTDKMRDVVSKMYNIKLDIYGREDVELKATNVLKAKSITKHTNNKQFADRVTNEILNGIPGLKIFAVIMDKPDEVPTFTVDKFPNHYRFLLQRINAYANSQRKMCVVAFDSQDEGNDKIISNRMKNYLYKSAEGKDSTTSVVESAFFVSSKVEDGIQLADLSAGIIRKYHELCNGTGEQTPFTDWIGSLYAQVQKQTANLPSPQPGQTLYGLYKMPTRLLFDN